MPLKITRRMLSLLLVGTACETMWAQATEVAGRKLDFRIEGKFGGAVQDNIKAVLTSAADSIWKHCPQTQWEVPGFFVYENNDDPIISYDHRPDGRIEIGLNVKGAFWAQLAYQFAHEFCHALAGHSNDWRKPKIRGRSANHWLEESFCETASLFALRSMGKTWQKDPPYQNWKSFANSLTRYADQQLEHSSERIPDGMTFMTWLRANEPAMRDKSTLREKNTTVAGQLLPLFEAQPLGWEAITFLNLGERDPKRTLASHIEVWATNAPKEHQEFIRKIGTSLGVAAN